MKTLRYVFGALLIALALTSNVYAQAISQVVVLGDSLSDNGNLYAAIGYPPSPPYWNGRASNGRVAVEYLAQRLGVPLIDLAWYGATTGAGNYSDGGTAYAANALPGMTTVFQNARLAGIFPVDPDALYVVWGGPNDFWDVATPDQALTAITKAVTDLVAIVGTLQSLGAKRIVVPNMPDLGITPIFLSLGQPYSGFFSQLSASFNQALHASLPAGVHYFDMFSLLSDIAGSPAKYGLVNVTDACLSGSAVCANPNQYLFFDGAHPTTAAHAILGNALFHSVADTVIIGECNSGVPNPLFSNGSTLTDLIAQAGTSAKNHGQFVSAVSFLINELMKDGVMSGRQKSAIQVCAAATKIP
jgi:cholinesterase